MEAFKDSDTDRGVLLTQSNMQQIHDRALMVLEKHGIKIMHSGCLKMLSKSGAQVDLETQMVRFPPALVEESLTLVPKRVGLTGRSPTHDLKLEPGGKMINRKTGIWCKPHRHQPGDYEVPG